jgi:hypothetical protein
MPVTKVLGKEGNAAPSSLPRTLRAVWVAMLLQVGAGSLVRERLVRRGNELGEVAGSRRIRVLAGIAAASGGNRGTAVEQAGAHLVRVELE